MAMPDAIIQMLLACSLAGVAPRPVSGVVL